MNFEFATAQRILFGPGQLRELPILCQPLGTRAALVTGSCAERVTPVFEALRKYGANPAAFSIIAEPTTDRMAVIAQQARDAGGDYVVAFEIGRAHV